MAILGFGGIPYLILICNNQDVYLRFRAIYLRAIAAVNMFIDDDRFPVYYESFLRCKWFHIYFSAFSLTSRIDVASSEP